MRAGSSRAPSVNTSTDAGRGGSLWEIGRRTTAVLTFGAVIALNGMAGSGALSGESIGAIASRYPSAFLPASYVFGIWSLIYLGLLVFTVDVAVRPLADAALHRRLAVWWPVNGLLNVGWIVAFSFERFIVAMMVMLALLANLVAIQRAIGDPRRLSSRDRFTTALPFGLYLAWISVAVIANAFQLATALAWDGFGVDPVWWSVLAMGVATGVGAFMALHRGVRVFPLVVAWALAGIAVRNADTHLLSVTGWTLACAGGLVFLWAALQGDDTRVKSRPAPRPTRVVALLFAFAGAGAAASPAPLAAQSPRFELELEGGPAWQSRNDVEIPNDGTASRFSLADLAGPGPVAAGRLYLTWSFSESQSLRLLLAPLRLTGTGVPAGPLRFAGASYSAGMPLEATYQFNSYRVSYRWRFHASDRYAAWVGFTAKVRDASIGLAQGSTSSRKDDLGFVPLLHLAGDWRPRPGWRVSFDADALAGGPGRAMDASLKLVYDFDDRWSVRAGYRTVEGGADVESVYAFAWLHYATAAVAWRW